MGRLVLHMVCTILPFLVRPIVQAPIVQMSVSEIPDGDQDSGHGDPMDLADQGHEADHHTQEKRSCHGRIAPFQPLQSGAGRSVAIIYRLNEIREQIYSLVPFVRPVRVDARRVRKCDRAESRQVQQTIGLYRLATKVI